jgi:hypothetical protein
MAPRSPPACSHWSMSRPVTDQQCPRPAS